LSSTCWHTLTQPFHRCMWLLDVTIVISPLPHDMYGRYKDIQGQCHHLCILCIYVRGLAKIFWLRKNGYIEWIQHVSTYRGHNRTSVASEQKLEVEKKKVVGLKVRYCVGAVFD